MPVYRLPKGLFFPPAEAAEPNGLIGYGGDLKPERLILGYQRGIFPWYSEGQPILWFSPDPRYVIDVKDFRLQRSLKKIVKQGRFEIRINTAFDEVIDKCSKITRPKQFGTWITGDMRASYKELNRLRYAHSFEAWQDGKLVGGLYGVLFGGVFAGESMFADVSNASKVAFVWAAKQLELWGVELIDCQVYTEHLERFGAKDIPRSEYLKRLSPLCKKEISFYNQFDEDFHPLVKS